MRDEHRCSRWCDCSLEERFWSKVDRRGDHECWPWLRGTRLGGYGAFRLKVGDLPEVEISHMVRAHRLAFRLLQGRWPEPSGLHGCDNPPCCNAVNPAHVHEGTSLLNAQERELRGRHGPVLLNGVANPRARFTMAEVVAIRAAYANGVRVVDLARRFGVPYPTMQHVATGRGYNA